LGQSVLAQQARHLKHRLAQQDLGLALHQAAEPHHLCRWAGNARPASIAPRVVNANTTASVAKFDHAANVG
jgi:hypothetical protein